MSEIHQPTSLEFARSVSRDIGETLCPIIMVTRRPDGTGLYQHYKGVASALEGAVSLKTLCLGENATIENIRKLAWEIGVASVVFCETFCDLISSTELKRLKDEIGLKVGFIFAWDSSELDPRDVDCINECVDVLLPVCAEFVESWRHHFVPTVMIRHLRLPLTHGIYESLAPVRIPGGFKYERPVNILSVASYHLRKNHDLEIRAARKLLDSGINCRLRIHSNLNQGEFERVRLLGENLLGDRFQATCEKLSNNELLELYRRSDIYLSCSQGEGCNIGLRAALSSGMPIVFTNIPGHRDLLEYKVGAYPVAASQQVPGLYPERSNQAFGYQLKSEVGAIVFALENAIAYRQSGDYDAVQIAAQNRKQDERRSKLYVWDILASCGLLFTHQKLTARRENRLAEFEDVLIVPSLDAGFFSIVNTYISHKLFWEYPGLYDKVLPFWSPEMVARATGKPFGNFTSYCYSTPEDGNAFERLFGDPGAPLAEDVDFRKCTFAATSANAWVDPNLTYIHSEKLYKSAIFGVWREEMSRVYWDNLRLQPHILEEAVDILKKVRKYDLTIAMHVRHPSHATEQRDKSIALVKDYVRVAQGWIASVGKKKSCAIVLATDQEEVVLEFEKNFPGQIIYRENVSRVSVNNSKAEKNISGVERLKEGRQIQHLMASNMAGWNLKNAFDVIADALILAMADTLVHVNSNVATIVSVFNPKISMSHIKGGDDFQSLSSRTALLNLFKLY